MGNNEDKQRLPREDEPCSFFTILEIPLIAYRLVLSRKRSLLLVLPSPHSQYPKEAFRSSCISGIISCWKEDGFCIYGVGARNQQPRAGKILSSPPSTDLVRIQPSF